MLGSGSGVGPGVNGHGHRVMNKTTKKRLFSAIQNGDLASLHAILDVNADAMETVGEHNRLVRDKTPLMFALQCANFGLANALLDRGAKASAVMAGGPRSSVLGLCVYFAYCDKSQHDDWMRLATRLLDEGADPTSALWPALHSFGGLVKRADLIRLLLDRGADPDRKVGNSDNTVRELVEINRRLYTDEVLELLHLTRCSLFRDNIDNPLRTYPAPTSCPSAVVTLAEAMYAGEDCSFALHDALLEAGHPELAEHFQKERWHPKGCRAVDLVLGKS